MAKTIRDLHTDAVFLAGLIGGADVLTDMAESRDGHCPEGKMARNSLPAIFQDMRRRAEALANELEKHDD